VIGTENLLAALFERGVLRLVHISSFSLYDYRAIPDGSPLDESSPVEQRPLERDEYLQTKLIQESMVRRFASDHGAEVTILRPGAIYGPGKLWNAGRALRLAGPVWLSIGPKSIQKLTYVENCAEAIVLAAEHDEAIGKTLNIVDDDLPTQAEYESAMRRAGFDDLGRTVGVPIALVRFVANSIEAVNRWGFGGRAKMPAFLVPAKMESQYRPLRYPNDAAKRVLGWRPRHSLDDALRRIRARESA
jgi:nucleoside-diphosphate-sugar epimerase